MNIYKDKNGKIIKEGMMLMVEGKKEKIYLLTDGELGINASNENYLENHYGKDKELYREFYPLYEFDTEEWEVVE